MLQIVIFKFTTINSSIKKRYYFTRCTPLAIYHIDRFELNKFFF